MSTQVNQDAKIIVHWLDKSRAQRVVWLLEELNVPYELKLWKRGPDMLAPEELKQVHPLGKSPVVEIQAPGLEKPLVLAESAVVIEYLADHFGPQLVPKRYVEGKEGMIGGETEEWSRFRYLMHYTEGSFMTILIVGLIMLNIRKAPVPFFLRFITRGIADKVDAAFVNKGLKTHLDFLEEYLSKSPNAGEFFCGTQLTAADCQITFALEGAIGKGNLTQATYPKLYAYVRRMQARDAYKRAVEKVSTASGEQYVPYSDMEL